MKLRLLASHVPWLKLLREAALLALAYYGFTLAKNLIHHYPREAALESAMEVVRLERSLGLLREATFQQWLIREASWAKELFNWTYTLFYTPALLTSALVGFLASPARYTWFRNAAFLGLGLALITFAIYPLAPPRMLPEMGFVDTLRLGEPIDYGEGAGILSYNRYAAMPSMHYGLPLLVAIAWASTGVPWIMAAAFLFQGLMLTAVIATGNHYFVDTVAAIAVIAAALGIQRGLGGRLNRREHPTKQPS